MAEVGPRPIDGSGLDALFERMRDPESVRTAAFSAKDPDDRAAFDAHTAKNRASPENTNRAITVDGRLAGSVASFVIDGDTELTYLIDRLFWGQGIASRASPLFRKSIAVRPLFARAASDNAGSPKVLQNARFGHNRHGEILRERAEGRNRGNYPSLRQDVLRRANVSPGGTAMIATEPVRLSFAGCAADPLPEEVGVTVVPGVFL